MSNLSHGVHPQLTGMIGYNFTYIDLRSGHGDNATSHNPTIGFSYRLTPTLTSAPTVVRIHPARRRGLHHSGSERRPHATISVRYARALLLSQRGSRGRFGGPTDNQTVSGTLLVQTLRDLIVVFNPAWTKAESLSDQQIERVDVKVVHAEHRAAYRLNPYTTIFGGYSFLLRGSASSRRRRTSTPIRIGSRSVSSSATRSHSTWANRTTCLERNHAEPSPKTPPSKSPPRGRAWPAIRSRRSEGTGRLGRPLCIRRGGRCSARCRSRDRPESDDGIRIAVPAVAVWLGAT